MLRFTVREGEQPELPAVDLDEPRVVIGSGAEARVRLPAAAARERHVEVAGEPPAWRALADVTVDGAPRAAGATGPLGEAGVELGLGAYRVRVAAAPAGAAASTPQRTESLARELVRGLLGAGAAPSLTVERGPAAGATRALAPPESVLVIGRGDEAGWVILDEDLSRAHAEIRRGWDGVAIRDLGSKNGTRVDGAEVGAGGAPLRDGALLELGRVWLRFRDPAEQHLRGGAGATRGASQPVPRGAAAPVAPAAKLPEPAAPAPPPWVAVAALAVAVAALAGLVWVIAS